MVETYNWQRKNIWTNKSFSRLISEIDFQGSENESKKDSWKNLFFCKNLFEGH